MISVFCVIAIVYGIFWGIFLLCNQKKKAYISTAELFLFFALARLLPGIMNWQWNIPMWKNAMVEVVAFGMLIQYVKKSIISKEKQKQIYAMYLFHPWIILSILYGNLQETLLIFVFLGLIFLLHQFVKRRGGSLAAFYPEYIAVCVAGFLWYASTEICRQRLSDMANAEDIPVILILSLTLLLGAAFSCIYRMGAGEYKTISVKEQNGEGKKCVCFDGQEVPLTKKDFFLMLLFTVTFAMVVFGQIGSFRAPETYEVFSPEASNEQEIVLTFDKETELSKVCIYLGYEGKRKMSFSYKKGKQEEWQLFDKEHMVESCFFWNEIEVNQSLTELGIDLPEGAYIHEIVCLDCEGNVVMPLNAGAYAKVFDEQSMFPEYATYYDRSMFDEVYHARTAYEFLHKLPIYENTHPPLGKTIISWGICVFGMNPFGWRVMCALCGTLMVPVMYLFAKRMFKSTASAAFATLLLMTEFMHFTLSRIATLDIIVALFVLLMFFTMYGFWKSYRRGSCLRKQSLWLLLCGISMAFAVSVKWTGVYAALGIAILFFVMLMRGLGKEDIRENIKYYGKLFLVCVVCFVIIPLSVYTLSYLPFVRVYPDKGLIQTMLENAEYMFTYHEDCLFDHPYSSEWYEWIINKKPLLDSYTELEGEMVSAVATFGNPLILWGGFLSLFHQIYLWQIRKCRNAQYLVIAYLSVMMPWLFIGRTVFIYQYFLGILILILMLTNSFCHRKEGKVGRIVFAMASIILFVMFYPVLSGVPVKSEYVTQVLEWMQAWNFV